MMGPPVRGLTARAWGEGVSGRRAIWTGLLLKGLGRAHEEWPRRNQKKVTKTKSTYTFPVISGAVPSPPSSLSYTLKWSPTNIN